MIIGGHQGLEVRREKDAIVKEAHRKDGERYYKIALTSIAREAAGLHIMKDCGFTPELLATIKEKGIRTSFTALREEDLGETEPVQDEQTFRRACVRMLYEIRLRGWRHGDLTDRNIIVRADHPYAIDWQESHKIGEPAPQKQPWSDSFLLFRSLSTWKDASGAVDPSRITRRWLAILQALGADKDLSLPLKGKSFLDLGCFQGDHVAMARAEMMEAEGVDFGGFRSGEDSIDIAKQLWTGMGCTFTRKNISQLPEEYFRRDVVIMFSTWPYLVASRGGEEAKNVLRAIIRQAGVFFFESQIKGDGPGPLFLERQGYVRGMLLDCGAGSVEDVGCFPVPGRDAERVVWMVRK